jgi:hypothetical protein
MAQFYGTLTITPFSVSLQLKKDSILLLMQLLSLPTCTTSSVCWLLGISELCATIV